MPLLKERFADSEIGADFTKVKLSEIFRLRSRCSLAQDDKKSVHTQKIHRLSG
jgi:hypothetical protein